MQSNTGSRMRLSSDWWGWDATPLHELVTAIFSLPEPTMAPHYSDLWDNDPPGLVPTVITCK